jgi:hypothetical protein
MAVFHQSKNLVRCQARLESLLERLSEKVAESLVLIKRC